MYDADRCFLTRFIHKLNHLLDYQESMKNFDFKQNSSKIRDSMLNLHYSRSNIETAEQ